MDDARGIGFHQRTRALHRGARAAAHDRERAILRAGLPARNGASTTSNLRRTVGFGQPPCDLGRDGGVIDEQRALAHRLETRRRGPA
jgi:hypothetical protein